MTVRRFPPSWFIEEESALFRRARP